MRIVLFLFLTLVVFANPETARAQAPASAAPSGAAPPLPVGPFRDVDDCVDKVMQANYIGAQDKNGAAQDALTMNIKPSDQTCFGSLFSGLNIFSGGLGLGDLVGRFVNQVCSAGRGLISAAQSSLSGCGIYASGFGGSLPGYGFGQVCQQLYVGGGGGDMYSISGGAGSQGFGWNNRRYDIQRGGGISAPGGGGWSDPMSPDMRTR
jgi:hypothetical protein